MKKEEKLKLKIFNFSNPMMKTEMFSLMGDKFRQVLPFEWEFVVDEKEANVIVWDGVLTKKIAPVLKPLNFRQGRVLIILGEPQTLIEENAEVKAFNAQGVEVIQLSGWTILPEEILMALDEAYKKLTHV